MAAAIDAAQQINTGATKRLSLMKYSSELSSLNDLSEADRSCATAVVEKHLPQTRLEGFLEKAKAFARVGINKLSELSKQALTVGRERAVQTLGLTAEFLAVAGLMTLAVASNAAVVAAIASKKGAYLAVRTAAAVGVALSTKAIKAKQTALDATATLGRTIARAIKSAVKTKAPVEAHRDLATTATPAVVVNVKFAEVHAPTAETTVTPSAAIAISSAITTHTASVADPITILEVPNVAGAADLPSYSHNGSKIGSAQPAPAVASEAIVSRPEPVTAAAPETQRHDSSPIQITLSSEANKIGESIADLCAALPEGAVEEVSSLIDAMLRHSLSTGGVPGKAGLDVLEQEFNNLLRPVLGENPTVVTRNPIDQTALIVRVGVTKLPTPAYLRIMVEGLYEQILKDNGHLEVMAA